MPPDPSHNIAAILERQALHQPQQPALVDTRYGKTLTFLKLQRRVGQVATFLQQAGLRPGDGVLVFQPMAAALYEALLALWQVGLVAVFVDPSAGWEAIDRCCRLYPPKALIASDQAQWFRVRSPALRAIPLKFVIGWPIPGAIPLAGAGRWPIEEAIVPVTPDTPALLTFTSGSTGQPKAALRTHGFLLAQHRALAHSLTLTTGQVDLTTLPIFALANLASGVTSLIPPCNLRSPGRVPGARLIPVIQQHQPQSTAASPALLARLADECLQRQITLPSLQRIFTGGAPVFPDLLERLQQIAPQAVVCTVYGSTEAEPMAHVAYGDMGEDDRRSTQRGRGLLVGPPVPEINLAILPDRWGRGIGPYDEASFRADTLPAGGMGEIVVSGEHVLSGYWQGMGDGETKFRVGERVWHRTGDGGYLDERGRLWLVGRCSARVQDERGVLYPLMVEAIANQFPGVRRSALLGVQGRRILLLERRSPRTVVDIPTLKASLAWARVDQIRQDLPIPVDKRHNAKIDYPALYRRLTQRHVDPKTPSLS